MSGFHILTPSWTSGATATSTSNSSADTSASNLLTTQPSRKWRSAALGTLRVTLDALSSKSWDVVTLLYHNGTAAGTLKIYSGDTLGTLFTAPVFATSPQSLRFTGDLSPFTQYHTWIETPTEHVSRYIGLEILDPTNTAGYFEAGVVMVGVSFMPGLGPDLGARSGRDDPSPKVRLLNGEAVIRPKRGMDVGTWSFPKQNLAETMRWRSINRIYGSKIPMVMKWDPISGDYAMHTFYYGFAQWRSGGPIVYSNGHALYDVEVGIEEV